MEIGSVMCNDHRLRAAFLALGTLVGLLLLPSFALAQAIDPLPSKRIFAFEP